MQFNLQRFIDAQEQGIYEQALAEIKAGKKAGHWMWFIFPQYKGLGYSKISKYYALESLKGAKAFLSDKCLGSRLRELCKALLNLSSNDAHAIFGSPDDLKFCSSMTLFDYVSPNDIFAEVLNKFYGGQRDQKSLELLTAEEERNLKD